jgi:spore coat protein U-like protein
MKFNNLKNIAVFLIASAASLGAWAAAPGDVTCSILNVGSLNTPYSVTTTGFTVQQINFDASCTRSAKAGQTSVTVTYTILPADNGAQPNSTQNRAKFGVPNFLNYDLYADSGCTTLWTGVVNATMVIATGATAVNPHTVWGCINQAQIVAAGTYVDSVKLTLTGNTGTPSVGFTSNNDTLANAAVLPVSVLTPPSCSLNTPLSNVNFGTYTAFGGALAQTVNMNATCTSTFPYTMSIAAANNYGVIAGLNYSLSFSNTSITNSILVVGTGSLQGTPLYAKMAGGQAGTCGTGTCVATSSAITLTITY